MDSRPLGNTGLTVSVMGLGCGGHSRLGLSTGHDESHAVSIVHRAFDLGINFIDTAESYGTEPAVGRALAGRGRDGIVISTKISPRTKDGLRSAHDLKSATDERLRQLRTNYIDILHIHGVGASDYPYVRDTFLPALDDLKRQGKIRHAGITEAFASDPQHRMLSLAIEDKGWEVMMVGFNVLNQSAADRILIATREKGIGVLDMFAVRRALSRPDALREVIKDIQAKKGLPDDVNMNDPLGFLVAEGHAASIVDASYRFCLHAPGIDVVLVGTGNVEHLEANARSLLRPPLPAEVVHRLHRLFTGVDWVSGN